MDDVPAGPASPGPRRPSLSVVIPVRNGGRDFERCLRRLRDSHPADYELIVVDDGSTDGSAALAESFGARRRPQPDAAGPGRGPQHAAPGSRPAPLVFFLDADVAVHPETLGRVVARFEADPELVGPVRLVRRRARPPPAWSASSATCSITTSTSRATSSTRPARRAPSGPAAARSGGEVFLDLGGFDPQLYRRPAIEDIELGYRLTRAGLPDRPGARRPGDPPEALDARRHGPDRHLPARRPLDAPDEAVGGRRDRPERQARAEALRRDRRAWRAWRCWPRPGSPGSWRRSPAGLAAIVGLNARLLPLPGAATRLGFRGRGDPATLPLLLLLRRVGR